MTTESVKRQDGMRDARHGRIRISQDPDYLRGYTMGEMLGLIARPNGGVNDMVGFRQGPES